MKDGTIVVDVAVLEVVRRKVRAAYELMSGVSDYQGMGDSARLAMKSQEELDNIEQLITEALEGGDE